MAKSYKVLVIGQGSVGKTSIATRYTRGGFKESHLMTLGANFMLKDVKLENGEKVRLSIWDTAGQERFRKVVETYYKGAKGCVLVYDITLKETFVELEYWKNTSHANVPDMNYVLVGNKLDLADEARQVTTEEAQAKADEWGMPFFEASAKTNININEIFESMTAQLTR
ncbi:MAG: GTP-binding protein [Candidatus Heimdallarchaeota archaeon]|nr:GTP-binding protein [Candidatus Heimdallarchaeota archaeon]